MVYAISMYSHEVFIFDGHPVDAFYGLEQEPWPNFKSIDEENDYWHDYWKTIEGAPWCEKQ